MYVFFSSSDFYLESVFITAAVVLTSGCSHPEDAGMLVQSARYAAAAASAAAMPANIIALVLVHGSTHHG